MYWREKEAVCKTLQTGVQRFHPVGGLEIPKTDPVARSQGVCQAVPPLTFNPEAAAWFSQCVYGLFCVNA